MKVLAIDDEFYALQLLVESIKNACGEVEIFSFQNVLEGIECAKQNDIDIAFLDIEMFGMTGLEAAKELKYINPKINIIFVTGYSRYIKEGVDLRMSGYILKPVTVEAVKEELDNLRYPVEFKTDKDINIVTFGNFDIFVNGVQVKFERKQAKEILAYLVDKRGTSVTYSELAAILWEDEACYDRAQQKNLQVYVASLVKTLNIYGVKSLIVRTRKSIALDRKQVDCDYYRFLEGDVPTINSFTGQYMNAYSWAEFTAGYLERKM